MLDQGHLTFINTDKNVVDLIFFSLIDFAWHDYEQNVLLTYIERLDAHK